MEDPYFIVKADVERALVNLGRLHEKYLEVLGNEGKDRSPAEEKGVANPIDIRGDIKTALRDVQYDIEDIEETVRIVEANPKKFKITPTEIDARKRFISSSKEKLAVVELAVRNTKASNRRKENKDESKGSRQSTGSAKYSKLESYRDEENDKFISGAMSEQQQLLHIQDEQIERVTTSIGALKSMSRQIGDELDHQNDALDDLQHEMDTTANRMDSVMKKLAKVTRLSDDKRQWTAIGILSLVILVLFFLLLLL